jgi:hypothetical protein
MSGRPLSAAARKQAGSRSPLRAAAIIRWATSLRTISSWPTSQSSSQAVSNASPIAAVASGSNAPCSLKGLIGMAVYPQPLPLTPPTQIGHKPEGSSNIIPAMPQFATACHIHKSICRLWASEVWRASSTHLHYACRRCGTGEFCFTCASASLTCASACQSAVAA